MLKTIRTRKKFHLLTFLAFFYPAIGAYAIHAYFHNHNGTGPDNSNQHLVSKFLHHPSINELGDSDHEPCPICGYFVINSAVEINSVRFCIPSYPAQDEVSDCRMRVMVAHQTGFQVRGPPAIIPA